MKIKKLTLKKLTLTKLQLLKFQSYKTKNSVIKSIDGLELRLKQLLHVVSLYHLNNKRILFIFSP